ncbi:hypothetical protein DERP_013527 [Dermatophagoides pteronyssinus]|uniref:Uncharacterized protein n=1 Tax=Dermatophagoides pteronyssinus TaxID=6956 RepID=A0ABQ8IXM6_DERPT|nr:hypothetical protein DERP_013527 [Dermatophagoides pteronyssinus]
MLKLKSNHLFFNLKNSEHFYYLTKKRGILFLQLPYILVHLGSLYVMVRSGHRIKNKSETEMNE